MGKLILRLAGKTTCSLQEVRATFICGRADSAELRMWRSVLRRALVAPLFNEQGVDSPEGKHTGPPDSLSGPTGILLLKVRPQS